MSKEPNNKFSIELQFTLYLERVKLDKDKMSDLQYSETKRAFFGAFTQCLMQGKSELTKLSIKESVSVLESQLQEAAQFWENESHKKINKP